MVLFDTPQRSNSSRSQEYPEEKVNLVFADFDASQFEIVVSPQDSAGMTFFKKVCRVVDRTGAQLQRLAKFLQQKQPFFQ